MGSFQYFLTLTLLVQTKLKISIFQNEEESEKGSLDK